MVEGLFVKPSSRKSVSSSGLVNKAEVDGIVERLVKAERINARLGDEGEGGKVQVLEGWL